MKEFTDIRVNIAEIKTATADSNRRIEAIEHGVKNIQQALVGLEVLKNKVQEQEERIAKLEKLVFWIGTTIVGSFVTGIVTIVLKSGALVK